MSAAARIVRGRTTKVTYILVATFGWLLYALGPSINLLGSDLRLSNVLMSLHMTAYAIGSVIGGGLAPRFTARWGRGRTLRYASFGLVAGLLLFTFSTLPAATISANLLLGVAAASSVTLNTSFLDQAHAESAPIALAEANMLAAFAGLLSPLVVGAAVALGYGWRPAIWAAAVAFLLLELYRGPLDDFDAAPVAHAHQDGKLPRNYWLAWTLLIATAGGEFMIVLWSGPLLANQANLGEAAAAASLATFTGGIAVGRAVLSRLASRFNPENLLKLAFVVPLVAFWGLWLSASPLVMLVSLFVCGVGMGAHWPLGIGRAVRAGRVHADAAAAKSAYATGSATAILPLLLGGLAERVGMHSAFLLVPAVLAAGLLLLLARPLVED